MLTQHDNISFNMAGKKLLRLGVVFGLVFVLIVIFLVLPISIETGSLPGLSQVGLSLAFNPPTVYALPGAAKNYHPLIDVDNGTAIYVNNPNPNQANVLLSYYEFNNSTPLCAINGTIPAFGMKIFQSSVDCPGLFGSMIIQSDQPVASVVSEMYKDPLMDKLGSYSGISAPSLSLVLAPVFKNFSDDNRGGSSIIYVQNGGTVQTNIQINFRDTNGISLTTTTLSNVPQNSSIQLDLSTVSGLPDNFNGSAFISSSGLLAAVARTTDITKSTTWLQNDSSGTENVWRLARVAKHHDLFGSGHFWSTTIDAINTTGSTNNITIEYRNITGTFVFSRAYPNVSAYGKITQPLSSETSLPSSFFGSVIVAGSQTLAVSEVTLEDGQASVDFASYDSGSGIGSLALPKILRNQSGQFTAYSLHNTQNVDANLSLTYYNVTGTSVLTQVDTLPARGMHHYNQNTQTTLGDEFSGAVNVSTDQLLVSIVDQLNGSPALSIGKTGPATAITGDLITYTLTITNSGLVTATNLIITDSLPSGATYVNGGTRIGNVISWTIPSLVGGGGVTQTTFVVTATQTITNSDYRVSTSGGYSAIGSVPVVVTINTNDVYLPIILKE